MTTQSLAVTRDHDEIRAWVERRSGHAAKVVGVHANAEMDFQAEIGALRIGFPGYTSREATEPISWDAFFEQFDEFGMSFYYQTINDDGTLSYVYEIR